MDGVECAEGSFTVPSKPPDRRAGELESLRFFESVGSIPQKEQRKYSTGFPQRTACYINFEIAIRNRLYRQRSEIYICAVLLQARWGILCGRAGKTHSLSSTTSGNRTQREAVGRSPDRGRSEPIVWKSSLTGSNLQKGRLPSSDLVRKRGIDHVLL